MAAGALDRGCHPLAVDRGNVLSQVFSSVEGTMNPEFGQIFESPFRDKNV